MTEHFLGNGLERPDFYVAAIGRSGSTMLCNWLTRPPRQLVFIEPFFMRTSNPRLLRIQLAHFGMPASDCEWTREDQTAAARFQRLMGARLEQRRWAFKEVLCEEHFRVLDAFAPPRVVITVRDIADVALSFFEKHRLQQNLHRFDDQWVVDYCLREGSGILDFIDRLQDRKIPFLILRYEDFTRSEQARRDAAAFVGWEGGGAIDTHLREFDREFEVHRHGSTISGSLRHRTGRELDKEAFDLADSIAQRLGSYQAAFRYA